ncbi:MAG: calcium-binding protein [Desulfuromonadaceae bacterium]|nr:calcium-binding protein [Desulfuromonadaceae bacterium]MDD5106493.1 calcium-binding protein [Desulfuromonadaceae bacterium]
MAKVFLDADETYTVVSNSEVYGGTGTETLLVDGTPVVTVQSTIERVELSGSLSSYTFAIQGNVVTVTSGAVAVATITVDDTTGQTLAFADGSAQLVITGLDAATLGGAAVTTTDGAVAATLDASDVSSVGEVAGQTFTLATTDATHILTAGDDTVDGSVVNSLEGSTIIDLGGTDTLSAVLTAALTAGTTVTDVENININWNTFGTATIDADGITGTTTITATSAKVGFLGNLSIANAQDDATIVAGSGMVGTLTMTGAGNVTVEAGASKSVSVTSDASSATSLSLTADTATSVTVADYNTATVHTAVATTISLTDDDAASDQSDAFSLTFGKSATLTNAVDDLTVTATVADLTLTVDAIGETLDIAGANNLTVNIAAATDFDAEVMTNSGTGSIILAIDDIDGASDLSDVEADLITVDAASAGGNLTVVKGQEVEFTATMASAFGLTVSGSGSTDTATMVLDDDQTQIITLTGIEHTTIQTNATAGTGVDLTLAEINAGTKHVILSGANDVTITLCEAGELDATALTNNLIVTQDAAAAMDIYGGSGNNTVVFKGVVVDNNYVGQAGNDTVTFVNTTANVTATVDDGTNSVVANALTTGTIVVSAGTGTDSVSLNGLTTGTAVLELGNGTNTVTFGSTGNLGAANITITTGSGTDTITVADDTTADTVLTMDLGTGTNTISLAKDMSLGTINVTGLTNISIGSADTAAVVNADLLSGQTITVKGDGTATDHLSVDFTAAGTGDFSNITIDNTITYALGGLDIMGTAGNQTIIGTSGDDVIDGNDGTDTITGGAGVDSITAGTGVDTFVYASGDSGATASTMDDITGFATTADKLKMGIAGTALNFTDLDGSDDANTATGFAAALAAANTALDGTVLYAFVTDGATAAEGWLFFDADANGTADLAIDLIGLAIGDLAYGDIIA